MRVIGFAGPGHRRGATPRRKTTSVLALVGVCLLSLATTQTASGEAAADTADTGFAIPFAGAPGYEHLAPTQMTSPGQLNQSLGQQAADEIAGQIGLNRADALSEQQYRDLTSGGGAGGTTLIAAVRPCAARTPRPPRDAGAIERSLVRIRAAGIARG